MKLYGFALLPSEETQQELIDYQLRHEATIGGPRLGLVQNLPHTSILQHPYAGGIDYGPFLDLADGCVTGVFTEFFYQPTGWLFAGVEKSAALVELHRALFSATKDCIDTSQIDKGKDLSGLTPLEQDNYLRYGYRYVGDAYTPHVTIGRTKDGAQAADKRAIEDFRERFGGRAFTYDRIAFYEGGDFGAFKRALWMRLL